MLFNSISFLMFFPIVTLCYFILPYRYRWFLLLSASCFFYMSFIPVYILILAVLILIDFSTGILIENSRTKKSKKIYLLVSIISTVSMLFTFKYFNFFNANFHHLADFLHWNYPLGMLKLALPLGLSFHTFQSLSYVIEVYKGRQKAERNLGIYSLYVMFFPQLVAGPIERPYNLLHQFREKHDFDERRVSSGLRLMLWGFFKKIAIADNAAVFVNMVYSDPKSVPGVPLIIATVFFAVQIYCDFSGYSDIAIGAARIMGFNLMKNFDRPYFSKSIPEFWRRWHISLSSWFRDYVYIPLGGNRVSMPRLYVNLLVVFLISGFWHGANWTFVIWGALHGVYMVVSSMTLKVRERIVTILGLARVPAVRAFLQTSMTFVLVCMGWVFFRAKNLSDALYILTHMLSGMTFNVFALGFNQYDFARLFVCLTVLLAVEGSKGLAAKIDSAMPLVFRWSAYASVFLLILLFGEFNSTRFIYFQF
jgi:alginate O-acetyltransferase complex protein AlgI